MTVREKCLQWKKKKISKKSLKIKENERGKIRAKDVNSEHSEKGNGGG